MQRLGCVVVTGCLVVAFLACNNDGDTIRSGSASPDTPGSPIVRFTPTCGSPGDTVELRVGKERGTEAAAKCTAEDDFVASFAPRVESRASVVVAADADCAVTVTVPEGATSGKIRLSRRAPPLVEPLTQESDDVFTIPCPADAGVDSSVAQPALGGAVSLNSPATGLGTVRATFFGAPLTEAQVAALLYEEYLLLSRIAPFAIALGTCGKTVAPVPEPTPADRPTKVDVGEVSLRSGGTPLVTMPAQTGADGVFYMESLAAPARDALVELSLAGGSGFAATTLADALRVPPAFSILSPDVSGAPVVVTAGTDLTITYPSLANDARMMLDIARISNGDVTTCVLPANAGTFTIPAAVLGPAGALIATLRAGYVTEVTRDGRRYVGVSSVPIDFSIDVE